MRRAIGGLFLFAVLSALGCTQAHEHEIDQRLETRFHFVVSADGNVDDQLRATILRELPPGSLTDSIYGYLDRHGFGRAGPSGPTPEPASRTGVPNALPAFAAAAAPSPTVSKGYE